ncbi:TetR/AcrR family transcriptional regulator [Kocuria palustris]|uniref:TetR/AcrR family transcriptional regulator n=1 Tax=Kocuria palustris TaxID=71999 RepID=UPI0011A44C63|nr:TetR/AcrR family transcriptional regulator [Kocuria palustris]
MQESSLRERKKAQTWHELHVAAAEAVLDRGLHAVTVEEVAASAGVSPRTFFNYFASKDHALLGVRDPELPPGIAEHPPEGSCTLRRVVELYVQLMYSAMPASSAQLRSRLMKAHPSLGGLLKDTMHRCEHMVHDVVRGWAEQGLEPQVLGPGDDLDQRIGMLVQMAGAVLRFVLTSPDRVPGTRPSPEDLDRAVELLDSLSRTDRS